MKAHDSTTSTIETQMLASTATVHDNRSPRPLAERELEHVAASGGKPTGGGGGDIRLRQ